MYATRAGATLRLVNSICAPKHNGLLQKVRRQAGAMHGPPTKVHALSSRS